jgi:pilus assembly protein Flp/PilA
VSVLKKALRLLRDDQGATVIEYGLIAALVSVAFIIALTALGTSIEELFLYVAGILADVAASMSGS